MSTVPDSELEVLPSSLVRPDRRVAMRRDICAGLSCMVVDARTALVTAQRTGVPGSTEVRDLRVLSGYRSARKQLVIWAQEYSKYYRDREAVRRGLPGDTASVPPTIWPTTSAFGCSPRATARTSAAGPST